MKVNLYTFIWNNTITDIKNNNISKMLQTEPNITPPFEISVAF